MKPIITSLIFHFAFLIFNSSAPAGTILQDQANFAGVFGPPYSWKGQTFRAEDPFLASLSVSLQAFNPQQQNTLINLSIYSGRGIAGPLMAQRSYIPPQQEPPRELWGEPNWVDFDLDGLAFIPGETYTFTIQSPTNYWGAFYNQWSYPNGGVIPGWEDRVDYPGGEMLTSQRFYSFMDMTFRVTPIPEPATLLLFGIGLGLAAVLGLKKRG